MAISTKIRDKHTKVLYLCSDIQVDHKVLARGRPEEKVEEASGQPQSLVAVFGK